MRALTNPLWLFALAATIGSTQLAPPARAWAPLLSQGMALVVAPALLAMLLGMRSRSALLACHVVLGQLYAGIQLSPAVAALGASPLAWWLGLSGAPAVGPQYLVCILGLVASYVWVTPGMAPKGSPASLAGPTASTFAGG